MLPLCFLWAVVWGGAWWATYISRWEQNFFRPETVSLMCEGLKNFLEGAGSPLPLPPQPASAVHVRSSDPSVTPQQPLSSNRAVTALELNLGRSPPVRNRILWLSFWPRLNYWIRIQIEVHTYMKNFEKMAIKFSLGSLKLGGLGVDWVIAQCWTWTTAFYYLIPCGQSLCLWILVCEFFSVTFDVFLVGWIFPKVWTAVGYSTEATACFVAMLTFVRHRGPSQFILSMSFLCRRCSDRLTVRRLNVSPSVYFSCFIWPPCLQVLASSLSLVPESRTFPPQIAKICKLSAFHWG